MQTLYFEIPGKPKVQKRPIVLRKGITIDPPYSKDEKRRIGFLAIEAMAKQGFIKTDRPVFLSLLFMGLDARADLSNAVKLVEDAFNGIVYDDDKQIYLLRAQRVSQSPPSTWVKLRILE